MRRYSTCADPRETRNLVKEAVHQPTLQRLRAALDRMTVGPLAVERFRP